MTFAIEHWLHSNKAASLDGVDLMLVPHPFRGDVPLSIKRGQALAFFLTDHAKQSWILKKFLPGREPDVTYIRAIRPLVPATTGFESGSQRRVLSKASVGKGYQPPGFGEWIENTILMPRIGGSDWLTLADAIRNGEETLSVEQRITMCTNLVRRVQELETNGLSHRDLSVTNVFVDPSTWEMHLIDWDGVYHVSLRMPPNTTIGTGGYTSPNVLTNAGEEAARTWCPRADRFAMAILCTEFLMAERGCVLANDGGMFEQNEIYERGGTGMQAILLELNGRFPSVGRLLQRAIAATSFDACPSPAEWLACSTLATPIPAPSLRDVEDFTAQFNRAIQKLQQPRRPERPAPSLSDLPAPDLSALRSLATIKPPRPAPRLDSLPELPNPQKT